MTADDYRRAISVENVRGETAPAGRAAQREEITSILQAYERSPIGVRGTAIGRVLQGAAPITGLEK